MRLIQVPYISSKKNYGIIDKMINEAMEAIKKKGKKTEKKYVIR
jgi:multimeric flavodoxin WrbA